MIRVYFLVFYYLLNAAFVAEPYSIVLTLPLLVLCCLNLFWIKEQFVIAEDMIWLIVYLFFVIGPCQAIADGFIGKTSGSVAGVSFTDAEITQASILVFIFFLIATVTKFVFQKPLSQSKQIQFQIDPRHLILMAAINIVAFGAFVLFSGGLTNVLASRLDKVRDEISTLAIVFLSMQMVSAVLIALMYKTSSNRRFPTMVLIPILALLFVSQNPFNSARYYLLASWLPIIFIFAGGKFRVGTFYLGVFFSILVLMPIFSLTTRFGHSISDAFGNVDLQEAVFHLRYIDVFDMLAYEIKYLESTDFFWGQKTVGMLLFFVPRSIWPDKASLLALDMGIGLTDAKIAGTPNLSMFFAGEFYADFGFLGVAVGAALTTYLLLYVGRLRKVVINGYEVRAFIFMAAVPILIRGPLGANAPLCFLELLFLSCLTVALGRRKVLTHPKAEMRDTTAAPRHSLTERTVV